MSSGYSNGVLRKTPSGRVTSSFITVTKSTKTIPSAAGALLTIAHGNAALAAAFVTASSPSPAPTVAAIAPATHWYLPHSPAKSCHAHQSVIQKRRNAAACFITPRRISRCKRVTRLLAHLDAGLAPIQLERALGLRARLVRLGVLLAQRQDDLSGGGFQHHRRGDIPGKDGRDDEAPPGEMLDALGRAQEPDRGEDRAGGERSEDQPDPEVALGQRAERAGERDRRERDEPHAERVV